MLSRARSKLLSEIPGKLVPKSETPSRMFNKIFGFLCLFWKFQKRFKQKVPTFN